jgi:RNA polymerase sigma-70 factor, ECF subfamily
VGANQEDPGNADVPVGEPVLSSVAHAVALPSSAGHSPSSAAAVDRVEARRFEAMVAEHLPALRSRASQLCRGTGDSDDVVQDALVRAFRSRQQLHDPARARGWLLAILTNVFLDHLRRRKARPGEVELVVEPSAPVAVEGAPWAELDVEDVQAAVSRLPDDVRDTYRRFALEGQDYVAIAAALGIPKATVGTRILRARKRLRELLTERIGGGA